ncbi:hypothetical protein [Marinobacter sp.]|uniref:hypothetical protein n=1 Tax=Marinobacter sp. TaxID=50741 RepID=UPI00384C6E0D
MKRFFKGLFDHARYHHRTGEMPGWVRRRLYRNLLDLLEEERHVTQLMNLDVKPRLCVVDETRVAMLRPADRAMLNLDEEMRRAMEDEVEREREQKRARREPDHPPEDADRSRQ